MISMNINKHGILSQSYSLQIPLQKLQFPPSIIFISLSHNTKNPLIKSPLASLNPQMTDIDQPQSTRQIFKRSSIVPNGNKFQSLNSKNQLQPLQKNLTQKSLKSLKQLSSKYLTHNSKSPSSKHLIPQQTQQNLLEMSAKDIDKLFELMGNSDKTDQVYDELDRIFCRGHLTFFQNVRNFLSKEEYRQLIDKCELMSYAENKVISRKGRQDQQYLVLVDGVVSYNEQKIMVNAMTGNEEIQYNQMFFPQKGHLLNTDTLNGPKHNTYTLITHSTVTAISLNASQAYSKLLKKYFIKENQVKSYSLSNTSLFKGISALNVAKLMPYFFHKNFYKFNQLIYKQDDRADFVYWILEGQVQLIKEDQAEADNNIVGHPSTNKRVCKVVKLSKHQIFGIDEYVFKPNCKYLFTARVCSQSLKTICISYKSLVHVQNAFSCLNENIDFYLKRATTMHSNIVEKNHKMMETKENIRIQPPKKKNKKNKKKRKNPESLEWWGLAQNTVGNKKYKLQLPKFENLDPLKSPKSQPMFETTNYRLSKIQEFRRKLFEQEIDEIIEAQDIKFSVEEDDENSPYKTNYMPKISKLKVKMLDIKPRAIDQSDKVKKKLLSYAKNTGTFCDKLNLD